MRRPVRISLAVALALTVAAGSSGCCGLLPSRSATDASDGAAPGGTQKVLRTFFSASTKSGTYDSTTVYADGKTLSEKAEFWVSGRKLRIDLYRDGALRISIRSADGKTAYFCRPDTKTAEPSVATPDVYLRGFTRPSTPGESLGVDATTGAERVRYVLKETSDVAGADNPWYVEDLVYSVKSGRVTSVVQRAGVPHPGQPTELDTLTMEFTRLDVGGKIPADTFEIPYPIAPAD